ncbi:hypothetical protein NHQ30_006122 [Ciborinia camelliae]|nr:hypothetical protein NHQ30_006122 [Ciborinia camelliae]
MGSSPKSESPSPKRGESEPILLKYSSLGAAPPQKSPSLRFESLTSALTSSNLRKSRAIPSTSSPSLRKQWSPLERDRFLTKLHAIAAASAPVLKPEHPARDFELFSQELSKEGIEKTPQECQIFYNVLVKEGSIAEMAKQKKRLNESFDSYLTKLVKDNIHQEIEEYQWKEKVYAAEQSMNVKDTEGTTSGQRKKINAYTKSTRPILKTINAMGVPSTSVGTQLVAILKLKDFPEEREEVILAIGQISAIILATMKGYLLIVFYFTVHTNFEQQIKKDDEEDDEELDGPDIALTEAQRDELEVSFKVNEHPDKEAKAALAERVGMTIEKVKEWFERKNGKSSTFSSKKRGASQVNRVSPADSKENTSKRQRWMNPSNDKSRSVTATSVCQTSQMIASSSCQPINTETKGKTEILEPACSEPSDPEIGFSATFAGLKVKERQRLESIYKECQTMMQEIGDGVKKDESEARKSLLAVQSGKRRLDEGKRKLELLLKNMETLDMIS